MTPEETQRTMDFILRSQADAIIRMDRAEQRMDRAEKNQQKFQEQLDILRSAARDLLKACRQLLKSSNEHSRRLHRLESHRE